MKTLLLLLWLLPALAFAQGVVNVNNRGLNPQRLVLDPNGRPLVGTNYVAQILYGPNSQSVTNELGGVMPFRVPTTASPGTWNPGSTAVRTLSGYTPGQLLFMKVYVWDSTIFPSWRDLPAVPENASPTVSTMIGISSAFSHTVGDPNDPGSLSINGFPGLSLVSVIASFPSPPPMILTLPEGGTLAIDPALEVYIIVGYRDYPIIATISNQGRQYRINSVPGTFGAAAFGYRSLPALCIDPLFYGQPADGHCTSPPRSQRVEFVVTPSPRRPFLDFALTNSRPSLTLRGLPPRSYRIEGSTNLAGWTRLGELSMGEDGNAPVPEAWLATNATQFVRFVPLPP